MVTLPNVFHEPQPMSKKTRTRSRKTQAMETPIRNILIVCTANVFRSPVAAGMTKQFLRDKQIKVESAGILEFRGAPLPQDIMELAERYGIDLSTHIPRQVNASQVRDADLILVFDKKQVAELTKRFPQAKNRIYTIKDYAGYSDAKDMEDLWNKPVQVFERFINELKGYVQKCVNRIESGE
jgi:protein-tyrosine-phosphatase